MVDSPKSEASHDSSPATTKNHASKDKKCQYCQQYFTSSSLGRHLDQFIFRKRPDGTHNVEEIRRLRGGITRRTTKGGVNSKHDREESLSRAHTASPVNRHSPAEDARVDLNATPAEGYRVRLNAPNWQSTGVINGLPGSSTVSPALEHITSATGKRKYSSIETAAAKDILGLRGDLGSEKDTARALELALREVLDTIQAAHVQTTPAHSPFPIELQSHSFPSLVLHLLPPPPTLLTSPIPFATPDSFPIACPPDHTHLNLLRSTITSLTTTWKSDLHLAVPPTCPDATTYTSHINSNASAHIATALKHLDLAYEHFISLPKHQQHEIWQVELARAFAWEKEKKKEVEESLEAVMAEARQLSGQVEYLSRCQWPREMALWPPERRPVRSNLIKAMEGGEVRNMKRGRRPPGQGAAGEFAGYRGAEDSDSDDKRWDYDTLVGKWKKVVREDAVRKRGLTLPIPYTPITTKPTAASNRSGEIGGATTTTTTTNNTATCSSSTPAMGSNPAVPGAAPPPPAKRRKEDHFEPWSKKPRLLNGGDDCMMGFPGSEQQQQEQAQPHHHSNPRDPAADSSRQSEHSILSAREGGHYDAAATAGGAGGGRYTYRNGNRDSSPGTGDYVNGNGNGNSDGNGMVPVHVHGNGTGAGTGTGNR